MIKYSSHARQLLIFLPFPLFLHHDEISESTNPLYLWEVVSMMFVIVSFKWCTWQERRPFLTSLLQKMQRLVHEFKRLLWRPALCVIRKEQKRRIGCWAQLMQTAQLDLWLLSNTVIFCTDLLMFHVMSIWAFKVLQFLLLEPSTPEITPPTSHLSDQPVPNQNMSRLFPSN